ncbi:MAG TPA: hypothetical protein VGE83_09620 [Terracidiphilus sp.]|jgi:hypothetical protein
MAAFLLGSKLNPRRFPASNCSNFQQHGLAGANQGPTSTFNRGKKELKMGKKKGGRTIPESAQASGEFPKW